MKGPGNRSGVFRAAGRLWKLCSKCGELLPLEKFSPDPTHPRGVRYECRRCRYPGARPRRAVQERPDKHASWRAALKLAAKRQRRKSGG